MRTSLRRKGSASQSSCRLWSPLSVASAESREWLAALPVSISLETPAGKALICHGTGDDDMIGVKPYDQGYALECNTPLQRLLTSGEHRILIAGHTHIPMLRRIGELVLVNAGTLHRAYEPCVGVLDTSTLSERFVRIPALERS